MRVTAVIPAAGVGKRFGGGVKKQFYDIAGHTVIYYTLTALVRAFSFDEFIMGASPDDFDYLEKEASKASVKPLMAAGGAERYETVYNCLKSVKTEYVLIHDAVRPFVSADVIRATIEAAEATGAAICAVPVRDTIKTADSSKVLSTEDRSRFILSHTPQVFRTHLVVRALENMFERKTTVTDEAQAVELCGAEVRWVMSSPDNIKITYLDDMSVAENLFRKYFS